MIHEEIHPELRKKTEKLSDEGRGGGREPLIAIPLRLFAEG